MSFYFTKTENRKVKQVLSRRLAPVRGGGYKERVKEVNMMEMLCTHV
jgi:hypothetical protein